MNRQGRDRGREGHGHRYFKVTTLACFWRYVHIVGQACNCNYNYVPTKSSRPGFGQWREGGILQLHAVRACAGVQAKGAALLILIIRGVAVAVPAGSSGSQSLAIAAHHY